MHERARTVCSVPTTTSADCRQLSLQGLARMPKWRRTRRPKKKKLGRIRPAYATGFALAGRVRGNLLKKRVPSLSSSLTEVTFLMVETEVGAWSKKINDNCIPPS